MFPRQDHQTQVAPCCFAAVTTASPALKLATGMTTGTVVVADDGGSVVIDLAMTRADVAGLAADLADGGLRCLAGRIGCAVTGPRP